MLAVARHIVALVEDQVRVRVPVAVASLTGITNHHRVAIITRRTPGWDNTVSLPDTMTDLRKKTPLDSLRFSVNATSFLTMKTLTRVSAGFNKLHFRLFKAFLKPL